MSLAPRERKALASIETSLQAADPKLAARMATFTELVSRGRSPRWKCLSPWRLRIRRFRVVGLLAAVLILVIACVVLGLRGAASTSPSSCGITIEQIAGCHDQPASAQHQQNASNGAPAQKQKATCPATDPACTAP